jgi:GNAT superfamily N-acetyltransferase
MVYLLNDYNIREENFMISYELEMLSEGLIEQITPILDTHRKELQSFSDMELNPNWDSYYALESIGALITLIARDDKGIIVGYAVFIIAKNMHYSDNLYATEDVFYVVQDKRGTRIAVNLLKKSEKILKMVGVNTVVHHAKFTNTFAPFLKKFGYKETEVMLAKRL